ncbi:hypothetical protein C0991_005930 [Blastosporella zonata]|nr:hypothetical protein C0991_005930 [Blastosporella zonata]
MNMWNNAVNAWWPLLFYKATDAPRFTKGMITMICVGVATLAITWLVWFLERGERKFQLQLEQHPGDDDHEKEK